jgi:hypothetical protein
VSALVHCQRERCLRFGGCSCACPACAQVRTLEVLALVPWSPLARMQARAKLEGDGVRKAEPSDAQIELFATGGKR